MNERIRELVRQAGLDDADFPIEDWDNVPLSKFAQLIVRECVQTLIDNTPERCASEDDWDRGYARAMQDCVHHIKEHFGVEL